MLDFAVPPKRNTLPAISERSGIGRWPDMVDQLEEALREFSFTPVLGSECSLIHREGTKAWDDIARQFASLWLDLDSGEGRYLESLAESARVRFRDARDARGRDDIDPLRRDLVKLATRATALFGDQMEDSPAVVASSVAYGVTLGKNASDDLIERLVKSCITSYELTRTPPDSFEARGVWARLKELTLEVSEGRICQHVVDRLARDVIDVSELGLTTADECTRTHLTLHQLEWLCDLIWYTFRFDAAAYPTNEELAFQVALESEKPRSRPDLPSAAQLHHANVSVRLSNWFVRNSPREEQRTHHQVCFYEAMAHYLHLQFHAFDDSDIEPIAFSTTFDLELEQALVNELKQAGAASKFHVVVPVEASRVLGDGKETQILWLFGEVQEDVREPAWRAVFPIEGNGFPFDPIDFPYPLEGPIVVKLHGSPLQQLPHLNEEGCPEDLRGFTELEHAVTLSESDYLQKVVLLDSVPDFLKSAFSHRHRVVCYMGLPLDEWNTRLRIHDSLHAKTLHHAYDREIFAINHNMDPTGSAVLGYLGVQRCEAPLTEVTDLIRRVYPPKESSP